MERQMSEYISERKNEEISLLEKLVNINSGTENIEGVEKIGEMLKPHFEALGFKTRWENGAKATKRAGTLIAERQGKKGKRLLLIGHLDTVFPKDGPFQKFSRSGNKAFGPGVTDMKSGDVIILYALKALVAAGALENTTIRIALTGDEENSGKPTSISRKPLVDLAKKSDIALDFEATTRGMISVGRRATSHWMLEVKGKQGHSSVIFNEDLGNGAVFEIARILNDMRVKLSGEKNLTFNPGIILGGTEVSFDKSTGKGNSFGKTNIIANTAVARGDLRYLTQDQGKDAKKRIENIVAQSLPGTSATVQFEDAIPPMPPVDANLQLFKKYNEISRRLGTGELQLQPPDLRGGGDISYIASYVSAGLVGIGANGTDEHSPKETLDLDSLVIQAQRAALLIFELTR